MNKKTKAMENNSSVKIVQNKVNILKDDYLKEIFKYLSINEKVGASSVCRKWNRVIKNSWKDVKSFHINDDFQKKFTKDENTSKKFIPFIRNYLQKYGSYLNFVLVYANFKNNLDFVQVPKEIEKYCRNLVKIVLIDFSAEKNIFTDESLGPIFKNNSNISKIHLENINLYGSCLAMLKPENINECIMIRSHISSKYLCNFLKQLKNVKKLNYTTGQINHQKETKVLDSLNKSNCENILELTMTEVNNMHELSKLIFKQKKLRLLELSHTRGINKEFMDNLPKKNLEVLHLDFCENGLACYPLCEFENLRKLKCSVDILTEAFMCGLTLCKNLKELDIVLFDDFCNLSRGILTSFGQLLKLESLRLSLEETKVDNVLKAVSRLKYLNSLSFENGKFLGNGLDRLYPKPFQNLKKLNISSSNITEKELLHLVNRLLKLEVINVARCKITNNFCKAADKIKKDRQDSHVLKLLVIHHDEIYKTRNLFNNSSLILIEFNKEYLKHGFIDPDQPAPEMTAEFLWELMEKFAKVCFNSRERTDTTYD